MDECFEDKRRGLFSYETLRNHLSENTLARQQGLVDLSGPVVRLQALTPEDLFVLLKNIAFVHASGDATKVVVPDEGIVATLRLANERLGVDYFRTPRDVVRSFIGLLNLLDQNPGNTWQEVLGGNVFQKPTAPMSAEEEVATGTAPPPDDADDDLTAFKL